MLVAQMAEANRQLLSCCCSLSPCAPQLPISNKRINSVCKTSTVFSDVFEISQWIQKLTAEKCDYINFVSIGNPAWRKVVLWGELRKPGFLGTCLPHPTMVTPACLLQPQASGSLLPPSTAPRCHLCPHQPCLHGCCQLCQMSLWLSGQPAVGRGWQRNWVVLGFLRLLSSGQLVLQSSQMLTNLAEMWVMDSKGKVDRQINSYFLSEAVWESIRLSLTFTVEGIHNAVVKMLVVFYILSILWLSTRDAVVHVDWVEHRVSQRFCL